MAGDDAQRDDDLGPRPRIEDTLRAIAEEVSRAFERASEFDFDALARSAGADPDAIRTWIDDAGSWLRDQAEHVDIGAFTGGEPFSAQDRRDASAEADPLRGAGPHPLDVPTAEQGLALAALESGRWTLEPGTSALASRGEGPGPSDALGVVRELRARDWIGLDGRLTVVGRHALERWLATSARA
jgi:hypothetical protein